MTSSNPNGPPTSSLSFQPFTLHRRGQRFRFVPTNSGEAVFFSAIEKPDITQLDVVWGNVPDLAISDFQVAQSADGIIWTVIHTTADATPRSYTVTGLSESTLYYFRVTARNGLLTVATSTTSSGWTVPATPTSLTATAVGGTQIDLSWTDVSTGNTGQIIERRTPSGSGSYSFLAAVNATATSYSDTGLTAGQSYQYRVAATNPEQQSAYSNAASATPSSTPTAAWTLDFSSGTPSGYTLTRASSGTYVDSSGYIASASTDVARLTHDKNGARLGLLVEEQRTNRCRQSEDLSSANWTKTRYTITSNDATAPDNTVTADRITEDSANNWRGVDSINFFVGTTNSFRCWSIYAKKPASNGRSIVAIAVEDGSNGYFGKRFDLDTGTAVGADYNTNTSNITNLDFGIDDVGNGWYRCWVSAQCANSGSFDGRVSTMLSSTSAWFAGFADTYQGDGLSGIFVWGGQLEVARRPSSYIPTTTADVTRSADLAHVLDSSITSWGDPGALVVHFYPPGQAGTLISTDDASTAQVGIEASTTTAARAFWSSGSTATGTIGTGVQKAVHYWNGSTSKFCINGGTVQSGTNNLTIGNTDFVTLGAEATDSSGVPGTFSQYSNCVIRKVEFYSGTLTDANLQTITT